MYEEILAKDDDLTDWLKDNRNALRLDEDVDQKLVERVTQSGYAPDLNDEEVERLGCDPFLIAYALGDPAQRAVVTTEVSRPSRKPLTATSPTCVGISRSIATTPSSSSRR